MVPAPDKRGDNFLRSGAITSSLDVGRLIVDAVGLYPMRGDEYDELLGAYALHSTELSEREAVQAHLAECPRCRAEVKLHHEMAALLCSAGSQAPPALWGRIVRAISEHPPGPTLRPAATAWPGDAPASTARWSEAEGPLDADPGTSVAGAAGAAGAAGMARSPGGAHGAGSLMHWLRALRRRLLARR